MTKKPPGKSAAKAQHRGKPGRPKVHDVPRCVVSLHGSYAAKVDRLIDILEARHGGGTVQYRNEAVQWAIDRVLDSMLPGEGRK
jgi:hypothetical protein